MATGSLRRRRTTERQSGAGRYRPAVEQLEGRCLPAQITEFGAGITAASVPEDITAGADGNLWFTEENNNAVARITPGGAVTEFSLAALQANSQPAGITSGPGGLLYFTEPSSGGVGRIGSINPLAGTDAAIRASLKQSAVVPAGAGAGLFEITSGPDGNLWFVEQSASKIGKITPDLATVQEFPTRTAAAVPAGIVTGPDGALWFTEYAANQFQGQIGRITVDGAVSEFPLAQGSGGPQDITLGPDGNLWFAEFNADRVGQISPSGALHEFPLLPAFARDPQGITPGPDGNLWFTEYAADRIGRVTPAGVVTEYGAGITAGSRLFGIVTGPDGNLWFTESQGNHVGRLTPDLSAAGTAVTAIATVPFGGPVASVTDPGAAAGGFAVTIDWGDGTPPDTTSGSAAAVPNQPGKFVVSGSHTYASAGNPTVAVTIRDARTADTATVMSPATVVPFADSALLAVTETGPSRATAGGDVTYTLTMTNSGPADAQDVTLTDVVPAGTTFVSAAQLTGPAFTLLTPPVGGTGAVIADPVALAAGQSATFRVVFHAVVTGPLTNAVSVTTTTPNRNPKPSVSVPPVVPVQLTLSASALPDDSPPGTAVGALSAALPAELAGQFLPALYRLPAAEADNADFALAASPAGEVLVSQLPACSATRASYQVRVHVDVGFGDSSATLPVSVSPAAGGSCQGGGAAAPGAPPALGGVQVVRGGKQGVVQELVLTFGAALDPASATGLGHYTIALGFTGTGKHRKAVTAPVLGASYDPARHTVTLHLGKAKGPKLVGTLTVENLLGLDGVLGSADTVSVDLRPRPTHKH